MFSGTLLCYIISKDMPDTRLILHVKGTQAETAELPKDVVRHAVSQGQLTLSQLIWSPTHNTWKQVRELPELVPTERLILHVKGTVGETREMPKQAVRAGISEGKITHSQLIWNPAENSWKQVRELPDLWPSQKLAPAPARAIPQAEQVITPDSPSNPVARAASAAAPTVRVIPAGPVPKARLASTSENIPHVRVSVPAVGSQQLRAAPAPQVRVVPGATPSVRAAVPSSSTAATPSARAVSATTPSVRATIPTSTAPAASRVIDEVDSFNPFKWIFIGLGALILLVVGGNYLLVDQPLASNLGKTAYAHVPVYAHFGAFVQPNVIVIHLPGSAKITPENLIDFMVVLAHSTPASPISRDAYERIALSTGWTAQYSMSGYAWKELGDMEQDGVAQQKEFLMNQLYDGSGQSLMDPRQMRRDQAWAAFVAHFTARS